MSFPKGAIRCRECQTVVTDGVCKKGHSYSIPSEYDYHEVSIQEDSSGFPKPNGFANLPESHNGDSIRATKPRPWSNPRKSHNGKATTVAHNPSSAPPSHKSDNEEDFNPLPTPMRDTNLPQSDEEDSTCRAQTIAQANPPSTDDEESSRTPNSIDMAIPHPTLTNHLGYLKIAYRTYVDIQETRKMISNRLRANEGKGMMDHVLPEMLKTMESLEKDIRKSMKHRLKQACPEAAAWLETELGVGEHLVASLIAEVGHPCWAQPYHWEGEGEKRKIVADPPYPRSVAQLWSYCGIGDSKKQKRKKGELCNWNPNAKKIVWNMADCAMKANNPLYAASKLKYLGKVHTEPCIRCGPSGKPAAIGTPWSNGHIHAAALRLTGKELVKRLWVACHGSQRRNETLQALASVNIL